MMKFDHIVMNPPYDGNLHLKVVQEAMKHSDDVVCLHPYTWLSPTNVARPMGKWRKTLNGNCKSLEMVPHKEMNESFGTGNSIENGLISCWGENVVDLENYGLTPTQKSLYIKVEALQNEVISLNAAKYNHSYGSVKYDGNPDFRREYDLPIYTWHGGTTLREALVINDASKKVGMVLYFNSEEERANFLKSLDTKFLTWYWKKFVVENGDNKLINYFFRMKDYTHPWDDAALYKYFGLTQEEISLIEEEMKVA